MQALTKLLLGKNKIGDQGAQQLANALQQNKVTLSSRTFHSITQSLFHTDIHHSGPQGQWNR
jgi:hypothetical protein